MFYQHVPPSVSPLLRICRRNTGELVTCVSHHHIKIYFMNLNLPKLNYVGFSKTLLHLFIVIQKKYVMQRAMTFNSIFVNIGLHWISTGWYTEIH